MRYVFHTTLLGADAYENKVKGKCRFKCVDLKCPAKIRNRGFKMIDTGIGLSVSDITNVWVNKTHECRHELSQKCFPP